MIYGEKKVWYDWDWEDPEIIDSKFSSSTEAFTKSLECISSTMQLLRSGPRFLQDQ